MKIVVTAGGVIWNESHPAIQKYGNDVVIVRRTPDAAAELVARVGMDRNVFVLTDNDPRSFLPLQALTKQFQSRRIHLFVCLPFAYESTRRKHEILELLGDLSVVKTLCLVELDAFLNESEKDETLGGLQLRIRNSLIGLLDHAVSAVDGLDEFVRYRYDVSTDTYREDDFSSLKDELSVILLAKRKSAAVEKEEPELTADQEPVPKAEQTMDVEAEADAAAGLVSKEEKKSEEESAEDGRKEAEPEESIHRKPKKRRSLFAFLSRRKD